MEKPETTRSSGGGARISAAARQIAVEKQFVRQLKSRVQDSNSLEAAAAHAYNLLGAALGKSAMCSRKLPRTATLTTPPLPRTAPPPPAAAREPLAKFTYYNS